MLHPIAREEKNKKRVRKSTLEKNNCKRLWKWLPRYLTTSIKIRDNDYQDTWQLLPRSVTIIWNSYCENYSPIVAIATKYVTTTTMIYDNINNDKRTLWEEKGKKALVTTKLWKVSKIEKRVTNSKPTLNVHNKTNELRQKEKSLNT